MQHYLLYQTLLLIFHCINQAYSQLSCMNEDNKMVDWFIALKLPKSYNFVYLTNNNVQWKASSQNLMSAENMVALTLRQSFSPQYFYAYYNDEKPVIDLQSSERGHLKGILNFGQSSGYWLIHSVPKFPTAGTYKYYEGEEIYGQSFICVSVSVSNLSPIVRQLLMMESSVYSHNVPQHFSQDNTLMSEINNLVNNKNVQVPKNTSFPFHTIQNVPLIHFGKSKKFNQDLYASLMAPTLGASLYVETWIRGERVPSSCSGPFKVFNVKEVSLVNENYSESSDHSKWAVSTSANQPVVCIGDINRMTSQFKRGGGSLCMLHSTIWKVFQSIAYTFEKCE